MNPLHLSSLAIIIYSLSLLQLASGADKRQVEGEFGGSYQAGSEGQHEGDIEGDIEEGYSGSIGAGHDQQQQQHHNHKHSKAALLPSTNPWAQLGTGISDMLNGGKKGAPLFSFNQHEEKEIPAGSSSVAGDKIATVVGSGTTSAISKESSKHDDEKQHILGFKNLGELTKLMLNPIELCKAIGAHFKLPLEKLVEKIGKGLIFGAEAMLQPLVISLKIVEKVFVPDNCRLKFICKMGSHMAFMREGVLRFSPNFLEGSLSIKALSDGIVGRDCESIFTSCEGLKLKKPFEELKHESEAIGSNSNDYKGSGGGFISGKEKSSIIQ